MSRYTGAVEAGQLEISRPPNDVKVWGGNGAGLATAHTSLDRDDALVQHAQHTVAKETYKAHAEKKVIN